MRAKAAQNSFGARFARALPLALLVSLWASDPLAVPSAFADEATSGERTAGAQGSSPRSSSDEAGQSLPQTSPRRGDLATALDDSAPIPARLYAIRHARFDHADPDSYTALLSLLDSRDTAIMAAALKKLHIYAEDPAHPRDHEDLIPRLQASLSHPADQVRSAAYDAIADLFTHYPAYRASGLFDAALERGTDDPQPGVRAAAMNAYSHLDLDQAARDALLERALLDEDASVRGLAVAWLGTSGASYSRAEASLLRLASDYDPGIRYAASHILRDRSYRRRAEAGELTWREAYAPQIFTLKRILAPAGFFAPLPVGLCFLFYFVIRLTMLLSDRRAKALLLLPVIGVWIVASYWLFLLFFVGVGHSGGGSWSSIGFMWGATLAYMLLGLLLALPVRR